MLKKDFTHVLINCFSQFFGRYSPSLSNASANISDTIGRFISLDEKPLQGYGTHGFLLKTGAEGQVTIMTKKIENDSLLPSETMNNLRLTRA